MATHTTFASDRGGAYPHAWNELSFPERLWRSHWWPAIAVGAIGIAASFAVFTVARNADDARVKSILELRVEWRARDFERKILLAAESVKALAVHVAAEKNFDSVAFHRVAQLGHDPDESITALDWAPYVAGNDREAFVESARRSGLPNYGLLDRSAAGGRFEKAAERREYLPVLFEETFDGEPVPLGFDLLSQVLRRPTALRARDDGKPLATPIVRLFTVADSAAGYQVYWPVYASGAMPRTTEQRRAAFRGMAVGRFRIDTLLADAIRGTPRIIERIDFFVDGDRPHAPAQHAASYDPVAGKFVAGADPSQTMAASSSRDFEILGQHWILVSRFSPEIIAGLHSEGPWSLLVVGLLLTILLSAYIQRERTRRTTVETLVFARTTALSSANTELREETVQRRRSEESLRESTDLLQATFDAAPFPIGVAAPDAKVLMWNKSAESCFGYGAAEMVGRSFVTLVPEDGNAEFGECFRRALRGERLSGVLVRFRNRDGKLLDISFSSAPVFHADGQLRALVYALEDVTQNMAVERQLLQAQKMEAIGNLTGGMAHDFNNLLGIVIGNLDLLSARLSQDSDSRELLTDALDGAVRGSDLTRRLLAFARRQPLRPESTDANTLVSGIATLLRRTLGEDIQIDLKLESAPWRIRVDPAQLEAAIINLATNARDAMANGGKLIVGTANMHLDEVYAAQHAEVRAGDYMRIEICDTGEGIPADILPRIFEPFFTTKEAGKGSGLGLSMVYGFMKQSDGHINVYSEPEKGTCFRLYLPRELAGDEEVLPVVAQRAKGGSERILVVEDNEKLRRVVFKQLCDLGYKVFEAESATTALDVLGTESIDLLFTDIVMPGGMNGAELAREARLRMPGLKMLFTSGFPGGRVDSSGWLSARDKLLSKPYRQDELARALREALEQSLESSS